MSNTVAIRSDRGIHPVDRRQAKKMAGRILHAVGVQDAEAHQRSACGRAGSAASVCSAAS